MSGKLARVFLVAFLAVPLPGWACPQCAGRQGGGLALFFLIGAMILLPFAVTAIVLRIIRRTEAERNIQEIREGA